MEKKRARMGPAELSRTGYSLLGDVLAKLTDACLEFLTGFEKIVGVVDHMGRHKDDELAAVTAIGLAAENSTHIGDAVQTGDSGRSAGGVFGDDAGDGNGVAILQSDLSLHHLLIKGWRGNARSGGRGRFADFLVDDQRDHSAGIHTRIHLESYTGVMRGDALGL